MAIEFKDELGGWVILGRVVLAIVLPIVGFAFLGPLGFVWIIASGLLLARPIVEFGPYLVRRIHRNALEEWEGKYYRYGTRHIRLYFDAADRPWFVADDVLAVIGQKRSPSLSKRYDDTEYGEIPNMTLPGFSRAGVVKLLTTAPHPEARKFLVWVERNIFFQLDKRKELGLPPVQT